MLVAKFITALPPRTAARARALRPVSRGRRTEQERADHDRRMAEIQANLAIESMPLTQEEIAFFRFAFELNVPAEDESAFCQLWNRERVGALLVAAE
jgi:hypothetical protein